MKKGLKDGLWQLMGSRCQDVCDGTFTQKYQQHIYYICIRNSNVGIRNPINLQSAFEQLLLKDHIGIMKGKPLKS